MCLCSLCSGEAMSSVMKDAASFSTPQALTTPLRQKKVERYSTIPNQSTMKVFLFESLVSDDKNGGITTLPAVQKTDKKSS